MAPIQRFSVEEKGKAPRDEPGPLQPKKRPVHRHDIVVRAEVMRPLCERLPPGYPLPLYAQDGGSGGRNDKRRHPRRDHGRRAVATCAVAPGIHTADSSRELVLWAAMPPSTWIRFPRFFSDVMLPRGSLEL